MYMGFIFVVMEMFQNKIFVMVIKHCEYEKPLIEHFKKGEFYVM